jgi:hypothetical protein
LEYYLKRDYLVEARFPVWTVNHETLQREFQQTCLLIKTCAASAISDKDRDEITGCRSGMTTSWSISIPDEGEGGGSGEIFLRIPRAVSSRLHKQPMHAPAASIRKVNSRCSDISFGV